VRALAGRRQVAMGGLEPLSLIRHAVDWERCHDEVGAGWMDALHGREIGRCFHPTKHQLANAGTGDQRAN